MANGIRDRLRTIADAVGRTRLIRALVQRELRRMASEPWSAALIADFIDGTHGAAYNLAAADKTKLVETFRRSNAEIQSGTSPLVHLVLAREILNIPPNIKGDVIECGCWKGASTASLSQVCRLVGRRLLVCDSFQGLPDDGLQLHYGTHAGIYGYYKEGMFSGALEEVRANIKRCGVLEVCEFIPGFFADTLSALKDPIVFGFLDVDLASSTRDCLRYLWPLMVEDALIYTDDAADLDVVRVFFDEAWWQATLGCAAPGYVGSGCGLPLNPRSSSIGYTRKISTFDPAHWQRASFLYYPDEESATRPDPTP